MDDSEHKNVERFNEYNKVGDSVKVEFSIRTQEYKGKYYTSLSHWRVDKLDSPTNKQVNELVEDLPF